MKVSLKYIQEMKLLFFSNYFIWMLIILLPIVESILMGKIVNNISVANLSYILVIAFLSLGFLKVVLVYFGGILDTVVRYNVINRIHDTIIKKMLGSKNDNNSEVLNIMENDSVVVAEYISLIIDFLCHVCYYVIAIVIMLSINVVITCIVVTFAILSAILHRLLKQKLSKYNNLKRENSIKVTRLLENSLKNKVSLFSLQNQEWLNKYSDAVSEYNNSVRKEKLIIFFINQIGSNSVNILIFLIFVAIPFISIDDAELVSFITLLLLGIASVNMFLEMANLTTVVKNSYTRINSVNSKKWDCDCSVCKKDSILFHGTIADNVCLWDIDKEKLERVLKFVNIYDEVVERNIYTYIVDENITTISLGQKCRLLLARSIYNASDIVYYENIFEHIDQNSVDIILENIKNQSELEFISINSYDKVFLSESVHKL